MQKLANVNGENFNQGKPSVSHPSLTAGQAIAQHCPKLSQLFSTKKEP
jgi:hypothetical protein